MKNKRVILAAPTPDGEFIAHYSEKGLAEMDFPAARPMATHHIEANAVPAKIRRWHRLTEIALQKILAGHAPEVFPPLDLSGTAFQKCVWNALRKISCGQTNSYGEIATAIGRPTAVRAVGGACGANPVPILVPCHRVLGAHGRLGGFSGGLDWKRRLLAREGRKF